MSEEVDVSVKENHWMFLTGPALSAQNSYLTQREKKLEWQRVTSTRHTLTDYLTIPQQYVPSSLEAKLPCLDYWMPDPTTIRPA